LVPWVPRRFLGRQLAKAYREALATHNTSR
jgi:hypothetical protein